MKISKIKTTFEKSRTFQHF